MSRENVELVQRWIEAWNARDLATFAAMMAPDVEWHDRPEFPDAGVHVGRDRVVEHLGRIRGTVDVRFSVEEALDAGDWVIVRLRLDGTGAASGVGFADELFAIALVRDGQVVRRESYGSLGEALRAVGGG